MNSHGEVCGWRSARLTHHPCGSPLRQPHRVYTLNASLVKTIKHEHTMFPLHPELPVFNVPTSGVHCTCILELLGVWVRR